MILIKLKILTNADFKNWHHVKWIFLSMKTVYLTFFAMIIFVSDKLKGMDILFGIKNVINLPIKLKNEGNLLNKPVIA